MCSICWQPSWLAVLNVATSPQPIIGRIDIAASTGSEQVARQAQGGKSVVGLTMEWPAISLASDDRANIDVVDEDVDSITDVNLLIPGGRAVQ